MFSYIMPLRILSRYSHHVILKSQRLPYSSKLLSFLPNAYASHERLYGRFKTKTILERDDFICKYSLRYKSKGKKRKSAYGEDEDEDDDDNENDEDELIEDKGVEIKTYSLENTRVDLILKIVTGYSRKRIEELFYKADIRLDGKILLKKSANVKLGSEIDIIRGFAPENPEFLRVFRIEILSMKLDEENSKMLVKIRKSKSLLIDNYPDGDAWKAITTH